MNTLSFLVFRGDASSSEVERLVHVFMKMLLHSWWQAWFIPIGNVPCMSFFRQGTMIEIDLRKKHALNGISTDSFALNLIVG